MARGGAGRQHGPRPARAARSSCTTPRASRSPASTSRTRGRSKSEIGALRAGRQRGARSRSGTLDVRDTSSGSCDDVPPSPQPSTRHRWQSIRRLCRPSSSSCCRAGTSTRNGTRPSRGHDAPRTCPRRDLPAVRRRGAREPVVPDGDPAHPHGHQARIAAGGRHVRRREPVRVRPGVPAGPVPADQPGGPHPGRGDLPDLLDEFTVDIAGDASGES